MEEVHDTKPARFAEICLSFFSRHVPWLAAFYDFKVSLVGTLISNSAPRY